ncbi:MAG TPA: hypothetical protein VIQ60_08520 [Gemmatimonadaceae bacterium]|jgi:Domain of unknown function (DUF1814).
MADNERRPPRAEYTPEAVEACEKALRTLLTKIGPWGTQLVLIGGMAPKYLVGSVPAELPPHVGTTDLDVIVGVALETDEEAAYRTLQKNLVESGFAPSREPETGDEITFRWERGVDGVTVALEFFCPAGDGVPGRLRRNPGPGVGSRVSAIRTRGAELAAADHIIVRLTGDTLDDGGLREDVEVRVANILPLLVLKSIALHERDKDKDAYDIVWTLNAYRDGPPSVAKAARQSPIVEDAVVGEAIDLLRSNFRTYEHAGPAKYARFEIADPGDGDERDRLRRYAHGTVAAFLRAWDLGAASKNVREG